MKKTDSIGDTEGEGHGEGGALSGSPLSAAPPAPSKAVPCGPRQKAHGIKRPPGRCRKTSVMEEQEALVESKKARIHTYAAASATANRSAEANVDMAADGKAQAAAQQEEPQDLEDDEDDVENQFNGFNQNESAEKNLESADDGPGEDDDYSACAMAHDEGNGRSAADAKVVVAALAADIKEDDVTVPLSPFDPCADNVGDVASKNDDDANDSESEADDGEDGHSSSAMVEGLEGDKFTNIGYIASDSESEDFDVSPVTNSLTRTADKLNAFLYDHDAQDSDSEDDESDDAEVSSSTALGSMADGNGDDAPLPLPPPRGGTDAEFSRQQLAQERKHEVGLQAAVRHFEAQAAKHAALNDDDNAVPDDVNVTHTSTFDATGKILMIKTATTTTYNFRWHIDDYNVPL